MSLRSNEWRVDAASSQVRHNARTCSCRVDPSSVACGDSGYSLHRFSWRKSAAHKETGNRTARRKGRGPDSNPHDDRCTRVASAEPHAIQQIDCAAAADA
ncbi:hypothetical protein F2P81_003253 [Scophthalmus maximus]|uniref:Uncharacterized protein n=1 Tax=Scophthalmus maximus TaxID=52904 RepID=A0A6A4TFX9_SCOMX|nr:hypothetical protein F2P81_003253 [Scophthalmus maximus]